jgi:hypothetical protein
VSSTYQLVGLLAILVGLVGTWLAAKRRSGWLLNVASTVMWLPALVTGEQWAAVLNCALSIAICVRNFTVQRAQPASDLELAEDLGQLLDELASQEAEPAYAGRQPVPCG